MPDTQGVSPVDAEVVQDPQAERPGMLAIDDEPAILSSLTRLMRPDGMRVFTATGGLEGLQVLEEHAASIGVVVCDYSMPGMTGAELLGTVRLRWPDITRVLLTGNADMTSAARAVNAGKLSSLYTKPWQPEEFREALRQALDHHLALRESRRLRQLADDQAARLEQWNARLEALVTERTTGLERANASLQRGMLETARLLVSLLQQRMPRRTDHYRETARLAGRLAERSGLSEDEVRAIQVAGLIHDIGLVGLPDGLLQGTPGQLPIAGREQYERHSIIGQQMLNSVKELTEMARWIRHHHERWDGRGYPDRLAGPTIPLPARIIAMAAGCVEAVAREGGTASSWRFSQEFAGEFDPTLLALVDDEFRGQIVAVAPVMAPAPEPGTVTNEAWSVQAFTGPTESVPVRMLRAGMILARPLRSTTGVMFVEADEVLTHQLVERIQGLVLGSIVSTEPVEILPGWQGNL
jgi:response regulator RpfG family c-di-GMP phosphodiesterase